MVITSRRHIIILSLSLTVVTSIVVSGMMMLFYPRSEWLWELGFSNTLSVTLTFSISYYIGNKLAEITLLQQALQQVVERDRLTDVATRDFFFARLAANDAAYGASLMIDIDHFKRVNDSFGHFAGDDVIKTVARVLKLQVREEDIVCRFGGEEFVIFLHEATQEEAWNIAERIRVGTEEATTHTEAGPVKVTVSVGGSLKEQIEHIDESIRRADACLYQAKSLGRNRTVVDWRDDPLQVEEIIDPVARARPNKGRRRNDETLSKTG